MTSNSRLGATAAGRDPERVPRRPAPGQARPRRSDVLGAIDLLPRLPGDIEREDWQPVLVDDGADREEVIVARATETFSDPAVELSGEDPCRASRKLQHAGIHPAVAGEILVEANDTPVFDRD